MTFPREDTPLQKRRQILGYKYHECIWSSLLPKDSSLRRTEFQKWCPLSGGGGGNYCIGNIRIGLTINDVLFCFVQYRTLLWWQVRTLFSQRVWIGMNSEYRYVTTINYIITTLVCNYKYIPNIPCAGCLGGGKPKKSWPIRSKYCKQNRKQTSKVSNR